MDINIRELPVRNSVNTHFLSSSAKSPCMAEIVKSFWRNLSASQSTFLLVLQKMITCVIVRVS